jgi:hypothetical protein
VIDPAFKAFLEAEQRRARWAMEIPASDIRYSIKSRPSALGVVYDVFTIDNTKHGRDPEMAKPSYLGTFPFYEEAHAFAENARDGKRVFYFKGLGLAFGKKKVV